MLFDLDLACSLLWSCRYDDRDIGQVIWADLSQVSASVTASFTILAVFKIPISHIPMEFYPVVIMVVGLENM